MNHKCYCICNSDEGWSHGNNCVQVTARAYRRMSAWRGMREEVPVPGQTNPAFFSCCRKPLPCVAASHRSAVKKDPSNREVRSPRTNQLEKMENLNPKTEEQGFGHGAIYSRLMKMWSPLLSDEGRAGRKEVLSLTGAPLAWETLPSLPGSLASTVCFLGGSCLPSSAAHQIH